MGRPRLKKLARLTSNWRLYAFLGEIEALLGNIPKAEEYLDLAKKLQKEESTGFLGKRDEKKFLSEAKGFIKFHEITRRLKEEQSSKVSVKTRVTVVPSPQDKEIKKEDKKEKVELPVPSPPIEIKTVPAYTIPLRFAPNDYQSAFDMIQDTSSLKDCRLLIEYAHLNIQRGFDDLLCLNAVKGVEQYWYQTETVKKVLKYFHGRVLLCDEVGLGKTIEAGMLIKEYLLRGMVRNILILTPPSLVSQWKEEMQAKFGIAFATTEDPLFQNDADGFWKGRFIIASIHTAKGSKSFAKVINEFYDLVIVDEAHHLKNRNTLSWKLVNEIQKRFIFLLTATPVQNNLIELFNLITLLKPGQFKTERLFKKEYVQRGNQRMPVNKEKLRELLRDVMIRNTRSAIDLKLPKRFASTIRLEPSDMERQIYNGITDIVRDTSSPLPGNITSLLMREAGSSPFALKETLKGLQSIYRTSITPILEAIDGVGEISKGKSLIELLLKNSNEKKVIFTQYLKSMDCVVSLLTGHGLPFVTFRGNMTAWEKDDAIRRFGEDISILVSTESGGEGRNLQFCNTIINFDLPWNPMRIEQRIGRLHRIGQRRDVFIFNLSVCDTLEDNILSILDSKINMFEMVIGEIEPILGYLGEDREFEDIIMEIWLKSGNHEEARKGFESFGAELIKAKTEYLKSRNLDTEVFGEDYEV
jgi:superfamily II DNA or RNA helicase